jgi:hypothetical protein
MASRSDYLRLSIRLIGPLLLIAVIWSLEDKAALWRTVKGADWMLVAAAIATNVPIVHFKVVRWQKLLAARGYDYPLGRTYLAVLSSLYLGMVTPGRVGDLLRIQYVKHDIGVPYTEGLATTLMDRFCDLYVLAAVVALGAVHFASALSADLANITWAAVALAILAPSAFLLKGPVELLTRLLSKLTTRWHASVTALLDALRGLVGRSLVGAVARTVASFAVGFLLGWLVARALGIDLSYVDVASLLATTSLLSLIPISVSGVGVRELFLALVFPALGLLPAQGVALGLMVFVCNHMAIVVAGFIAWQLAPPPVDSDGTVPA